MKRTIFCIFFAILSASLFAQSNSETRRFVGTWRTQREYMGTQVTITYIFNDNGTGSMSVVVGRGSPSTSQIRYMLSGSKFILKSDAQADVCDYYFSPNGNVLVLGGLSTLGTSMSFWLDKQ
jgi:hypothetical protein